LVTNRHAHGLYDRRHGFHVVSAHRPQRQVFAPERSSDGDKGPRRWAKKEAQFEEKERKKKICQRSIIKKSLLSKMCPSMRHRESESRDFLKMFQVSF
jgi:hypothetical protein